MSGAAIAAVGNHPADLPVLTGLPGQLGEWALFLDLDGTLIDIADRPEAVVVPPDLLPSLATLSMRLSGAIAIVTGRKLEDVDKLLGPIQLPVAGLHGAAIRMQGKVLNPPEVTDVPDELCSTLLDFVRAHPGLLLEPKGESVAVHYRNAPTLGPLVETTVAQAVSTLAPMHDIQPGKMVYEIKPRGVNKGRAIQALLETECFRGKRPAVFGDDLTDEAGFAVAGAIKGLATIIGTPERTTLAAHRLDSPGDMRSFLETLAKADPAA